MQLVIFLQNGFFLPVKSVGTPIVRPPKTKKRLKRTNGMKKKKKIAVLEIEFNPDEMWDEEDAIREHGSYFEAMQWLYDQEGLGMFDEEIKLVDIKDANT